MMKNGLIHIYCGDGKGKTTAAVGLAVRAAGSGMRVLIGQFFKDGSSSELVVLRSVPNITVYSAAEHYGRYAGMTEEQRAAAARCYRAYLDELLRRSMEYDLLVLDEIASVCRYGMVDVDTLCAYLDSTHPEVVLTGREPPEVLLKRADYITEMKKVCHPLDRGISSRRGIEY